MNLHSIKLEEEKPRKSHIAGYSATKAYTKRRLEEILDNAISFIAKIDFILEDY